MKDKQVINPADIAIALSYDGQNAPEVVATGKGNAASKIIALAEQNDIPLQADSALAEMLCDVPLGDEIPEKLYLAVAKVLAFAYMVSGELPPQKTKDC
jgi:flagellar biosynthesis protein